MPNREVTGCHTGMELQTSVNGPLGSSHSLAIVDIAAVNTGVQVPLQITALVSVG